MTAELTGDVRAVAAAVRGRASRMAEGEVGDSFDRRVDDSADLLDHNEPVVAFENAVSNIHECSVAITQDEFAVIEALRWGGRSVAAAGRTCQR